MKKNELGIIPVYGNIYVTADRQTVKKSEAGIITGDIHQVMNDHQRVLAVGPDCPPYIKENDIIVLNLDPNNGSRFAILKRPKDTIVASINGNFVDHYEFPIREIDKREVMLIYPRDIEYVIPVNKAHFTEDN